MKTEATLGTSVQYLKGVGPERFKVLTRLGLSTLEDVFYFFPRRYEDRRRIKRIRELAPGEKECVRGAVSSRGVIRTRHGVSIFRVVLSEPGGGVLFAAWFNQPYLAQIFLPKTQVIFYGKAEREGRHLQMFHPEYEILTPGVPRENIHSGRIVPVYPLTEDLGQKGIRGLLFRVLKEHLSLMADPFFPNVRQRLGLADSPWAFRQIHFPDSPESIERAYERLVFDEFLMMQLLVQRKKVLLRKENKELSHASGEEMVARLIGSLGFTLTLGQAGALEKIIQDMRKEQPMNRLVQGDVGSGKTAVAAAALAFTVANGFQGALMAPTEILAQQHFFTLTQLLEPLDIHCVYLAQNLSAEEKKRTLEEIDTGRGQVVIGTHALIQQKVRFQKLGLAVVDEQHKFGVFQRTALFQKGPKPPHFLLMTATPIPRTLALTLYGDLDISTIAELPEGRKPVKTFWIGENRRAEVYRLLDSLLAGGAQGYVICPLIDRPEGRGEPKGGKSVSAEFTELQKVFSGHKIGYLHGRMKSDEKRKIMRDFKEKRLKLLVSTVVIEVGVDVPDASFMIIENAERFGLAQLHQLRGRVGRGREESLCILFSSARGGESDARLQAFEETASGFDIAEKDLAFRGVGDVMGARQHGLGRLRIGDFAKDTRILMRAKEEAVSRVEADPDLQSSANRALRKALERRFHGTFEKAAALTS